MSFKLNPCIHVACSSHVIMCEILPRTTSIHPNTKRRRLTNEELWQWNQKAMLVNESLQAAAMNTTSQKLSYLALGSKFIQHGKVRREMLAMDGLHLNRKGHQHVANRILTSTLPFRQVYKVW